MNGSSKQGRRKGYGVRKPAWRKPMDYCLPQCPDCGGKVEDCHRAVAVVMGLDRKYKAGASQTRTGTIRESAEGFPCVC